MAGEPESSNLEPEGEAESSGQNIENGPGQAARSKKAKPDYFIPRLDSSGAAGDDKPKVPAREVAKTLLEKREASLASPSAQEPAKLLDNLKEAAEATREVAKTLLEQTDTQDKPAQPAAEVKKTIFIPRLKLASDVQETATAPPPSQLTPEFLKAAAQATRTVARTVLDHGAVKDVVRRSFAEQEAKLAEELKNRPSEPLKPVKKIDKFRNALTCDSQWESMEGTDKARFCGKCQLRVYDLSGMDNEEADALVFKLENRKKATLFKRKDGKFLTSDCPVAARKRLSTMAAAVAGLLILSVVAFVFLSMPPPKPQATGQPPGEPSSPKVQGQVEVLLKPSAAIHQSSGARPLAGSSQFGAPSNFFAPDSGAEAPADSGYGQSPGVGEIPLMPVDQNNSPLPPTTQAGQSLTAPAANDASTGSAGQAPESSTYAEPVGGIPAQAPAQAPSQPAESPYVKNYQ